MSVCERGRNPSAVRASEGPGTAADRPLARLVWRAGGLGVAVALVAALYWTVRLARADWAYQEGNRNAIRRAVRLAPTNPDYYSAWAQIEPEQAIMALERAVELNAASAGLRVQLALAAEATGDFRKAEANLLEAVRLDRTFAPRWMLSEYYFRRRDAAKFWPAVKAALATSYDDVTPLFAECWDLSTDGETILRRAIPKRQDIIRQYLVFLVGSNRIKDAAPLAGKLLAGSDKAALPELLRYCDHLLEEGRRDDALGIWNGLSQRKLIPYHALSPGSGNLVTNAAFSIPSLEAGFDWRFSSPAGIFVDRVGQPPEIHLGFSGKQAENCEILSQYVPVEPRRTYELSVEYRTAGIETASGLMCRVLAGTGNDLLQGGGVLPGGSEQARQIRFRFAVPDRTPLVRLALGYRRIAGTTRIEGSVVLHSLAVTPAPGDAP